MSAVPSQLDDIIESIKDVAAEENNKILTEDFNKISQSAKSLANKLKIVETQTINLKNIQEQQLKIINNNLNIKIKGVSTKKLTSIAENNAEIKSYLKLRGATNDILQSNSLNDAIKQCFEFHAKVNSLIGREIRTLITHESGRGTSDKKIQILLAEKEEDIIHLDFKDGEITARLASRNLENLTTALYDTKRDLDFEINTRAKTIAVDENKINSQATRLLEARNEIRRRFDLAKKNNNNYQVPYIKSGHYAVTNLSNLGDLDETFTVLQYKILNNIGDVNFSNNLEDNIAKIFDIMREQVDNASGLFRGDFSAIEDGKRIEYSIKSANASLTVLNQIIVLVNAFADNKINNVTQLKKIAEKLESGVTRNKETIYENIDALTQQAFDNIIGNDKEQWRVIEKRIG